MISEAFARKRGVRGEWSDKHKLPKGKPLRCVWFGRRCQWLLTGQDVVVCRMIQDCLMEAGSATLMQLYGYMQANLKVGWTTARMNKVKMLCVLMASMGVIHVQCKKSAGGGRASMVLKLRPPKKKKAEVSS